MRSKEKRNDTLQSWKYKQAVIPPFISMKSNCIYMVLISDSIQAIVSCIMYYTAMFYKNVREYRGG